MGDVVNVEYINSVHMKVTADPGIRQEISEYFSFKPEGWQFNPKVRARVWDGTIRLYQPMRPTLYVGLLPKLKEFCEARDYHLNVPDEIGLDEKIDDDYGIDSYLVIIRMIMWSMHSASDDLCH